MAALAAAERALADDCKSWLAELVEQAIQHAVALIGDDDSSGAEQGDGNNDSSDEENGSRSNDDDDEEMDMETASSLDEDQAGSRATRGMDADGDLIMDDE